MYTYREREIVYRYIYIYMYTYVHMCIYIYIYIYSTNDYTELATGTYLLGDPATEKNAIENLAVHLNQSPRTFTPPSCYAFV